MVCPTKRAEAVRASSGPSLVRCLCGSVRVTVCCVLVCPTKRAEAVRASSASPGQAGEGGCLCVGLSVCECEVMTLLGRAGACVGLSA